MAYLVRAGVLDFMVECLPRPLYARELVDAYGYALVVDKYP